MTIEQISQDVSAVKPSSPRQIKRYLKQFDIKPAGARTRPQNYPDNAPALILMRLGYETALLPLRPIFTTAKALVTAKELKAAKRKAGR